MIIAKDDTLLAASRIEIFEIIKSIIAEIIEEDPTTILIDSKLNNMGGWDSLLHVEIIVKIQGAFGIKINSYEMEKTITINGIIDIVCDKKLGIQREELEQDSKTFLHRGLRNIYYDKTSITNIEENLLIIRGINIQDIVPCYNFEEMIGLLIFGNAELQTILKEHASSPNHSIDEVQEGFKILKVCKDDNKDIIKCIISFLLELNGTILIDSKNKPIFSNVIVLIRRIAQTVCWAHNIGNDHLLHNPCSHLGLIKNIFYMLEGKEPDQLRYDLLQKLFILQAEHGSNASTFVARIAISAGTSPIDAIIAAISTFRGKLHGGAAVEAAQFFDDCFNDDNNMEMLVQEKIVQDKRIPGLGHVIYKYKDPRAEIMRDMIFSSPLLTNELRFKILNMEKVLKTYTENGLPLNVDFYVSIIYRLCNLPKSLILPLFVVARSAGWIANIFEQTQDNILIRPRLLYNKSQ